MRCKIYRVKNGRLTNLRKDPEKILRLTLEGKAGELLIEIDERYLRE